MLKSPILIVEDHMEFRQALKRFLEISHIKNPIIEAPSGEQGVSIALKSKPKLVIMDFVLGGMNGIEAARKIKMSDPECSIILLTMLDDPKEIFSIETHQFIKAFVSKNELYDKLLPVIHKIIDQK